MPCSSTSQLTNANSVTLPGTIPTTQAQWSVFVQRLQQMLNLVGDATTKTGVNVIPPTYAVYDGAALPTLTVTGATPALDSSLSQFGNASLKLTATATTVTVEFPSGAIPIAPFTRWIESVYIQSSRTSITGTLAVVTASGSYSVNIGGTLTPAQWGRLYGDCDLTADSSTVATLLLTLTGVTVGDTFHLEAWQLEAASGQTNLPTAFNLSRAPGALGQVPDDTTYAKILASHTAGNVAYNFRGVWASATGYLIGDETVYAGSYWLCTQANTGQAPAQSSAYWQAVGAYNDYQGAWSATVAYQPGMEVTYGGNFWVCAAANTNSQPAIGNANWAMAGPQSLDNVTDGGSRFAATASGTTPTVANPNFQTGLAGWSPDAAGWSANSTSASSPNPQITTFAEYYRSGFSGNGGLYNNTVNSCQAGDRFTATGQILANGGTGNAYVGIAWFNASKSLIISSFGNPITGTTTGTSRVVGTAPAGAVYCEAVCAVLNYTGSGAYTFTGVTLTPQPNTLNETPDGTSRFAVINGAGFKGVSSVDVNNRAGIDFTQNLHIGRHLGNMPDDPTSSRFAVANIDGNRRALVDFSQGAHLNKTQDYIGDGTTYARAKAAALQNGIPLQANTGRNLVVNGSFEAMLSGAAFGDGWTGGGAILGRATGVSGAPSNAVLQYNQAPGSVIATGTTFYAINSATNLTGLHVGDTIYLSAQFDNAGGSLPAGITGTVQVAINFINSAGSVISSIGAVSPQTTGWPIATGKGVVPSGTVSAQVQVLIFTNNTTGTAYTVPAGQFPFFGYVDNIAAYAVANADTDVMDGTVHGRIAMQDVFQVGGVNRAGLRVAGSGYTVGDQRNLMPVTWAGVRSVLSASPITFSITSGSPNSTVNFSVAAVSLYAGSVTVSYNASSGSHAQVNGTTATYYLFYRDATGAGGSQTLYITVFPQTLAQYNDAVLIGSCVVTVASGGGGSGGTGSGGGGYCVADSMFVREGHLAGDAEIGDPFDCIDLPTAAGKHVRSLQGVSRGMEECVRMITSDGCALVCSVSTPFDLPNGHNTTALHMLGEQVITDLGTAIVTSLALVGPQPVTRANLGGVSYAAGSDPHRRIYSHNATSKP